MKKVFTLALAMVLVFAACSKDSNDKGKDKDSDGGQNKAVYVTNTDHLAMINSLVRLDDLGRIYEMDYTADYMLDEMLKTDVHDMSGVMRFVATHLFDSVPPTIPVKRFNTDCSMFAVTSPQNGDRLMGRNYDFSHVENGKEVPLPVIVVKTAPKGGKRSICIVDGYWLGFERGFFGDGKSDLSMLMAAPYIFMDGINEDGFAIGVLAVDGNPALQNDPDKRTIWTTAAMRLLIDRASTVDDAITLLKQRNIRLKPPGGKGNFHFFLADAKGDYAVVEYSYRSVGDFDKNPDQLVVLKGQDYSYVTNFYVDPTLAGDSLLGSESKHGKDRYEKLREVLTMKVNKLTEVEAMKLLGTVAQDAKPGSTTSHTQWSTVYNLTQKSLGISILQEYGKVYSFKVGCTQ